MARTVARVIVDALSELGVRQVFGVVGDALNPVTDAIRTTEGLEWVGCRHEEAAAFAASAQSQLSGTLGVCMGTVGPGAVHLLNGLYDAAKSRTPVLAIAGQVPLAEIGSDYFQEVDNDALFSDVAVFRATITSPDQLPQMLETAVRHALGRKGVAVLTVPGDLGEQELTADRPTRFSLDAPVSRPDESGVRRAAELLDRAERVTLLVGQGARAAREDVLALADRLAAPMVLTLKAKAGFEGDGNPFQVGQTGLIGNPAAASALQDADTLLLLGTDFPYRDWYPEGRTVIQVDTEATHIGRRVPVDVGLVGDTGATVRDLLVRLAAAPPGPRAPGTARTSRRRVNVSTGGARARPGWPTRRTTRAWWAASAPLWTTARTTSARRRWPPSWTKSPPTTPSSPPTRVWRRCGCRGSSRCAVSGG